MAGFVDDGDGVSSLARLEAADEVWEIAATLQSTKRRHRRPLLLPRPSPAPLALHQPPESFLSRALLVSSRSHFLHRPRRVLPAALSPSSFLVGGDNSSSASAHTSGLIPLQPPCFTFSLSLSFSFYASAHAYTGAQTHTYTLGRVARGQWVTPHLHEHT